MAAKAALRPFQTRRAFGVGLRERGSSHAPFFGRARGRLHLGVDFVDGAVELDEQERFADGVVGVDGGFGGQDGEAVHHLHRGGKHAGGDDVGDGLAGGGDGVECGEEDLHASAGGDDAEDDFGGDAECAFAADEDAGKIVAGGVGSCASRA